MEHSGSDLPTPLASWNHQVPLGSRPSLPGRPDSSPQDGGLLTHPGAAGDSQEVSWDWPSDPRASWARKSSRDRQTFLSS